MLPFGLFACANLPLGLRLRTTLFFSGHPCAGMDASVHLLAMVSAEKDPHLLPLVTVVKDLFLDVHLPEVNPQED